MEVDTEQRLVSRSLLREKTHLAYRASAVIVSCLRIANMMTGDMEVMQAV